MARFERQNQADCYWILHERGITKADCLRSVAAAGIEVPAMYRLGYSNNNCIGCVKGGAGYWNRIRVDFPEAFERMALLEREMGHACLQLTGADGARGATYLDELDPNAGRFEAQPIFDCGVLCEGWRGETVVRAPGQMPLFPVGMMGVK